MLSAAIITCQLLLPGLLPISPEAPECKPPSVNREVLTPGPRTLVAPVLDFPVETGSCLVYAQGVFNAPVMYDSAWQAWEATQLKFDKSVQPSTEVATILWFAHEGTYFSFSKGVYEYGNWGHVAVYIPGDGIYTSPATGIGYERYDSVDQIEANFNAVYVGWSLDINGLQVSSI